MSWLPTETLYREFLRPDVERIERSNMLLFGYFDCLNKLAVDRELNLFAEVGVGRFGKQTTILWFEQKLAFMEQAGVQQELLMLDLEVATVFTDAAFSEHEYLFASTERAGCDCPLFETYV
jgi:hypothetical protein